MIVVSEKYPQIRHKVGEVDFCCPNCNKYHRRVLWEHATEWDVETKKPIAFDHIAAFAKCRCGALLLVADTWEAIEMFWLNQHEMEAS